MNLKRISLFLMPSLALFLFSINATAQTFNDALRYSQFQWGGTARFMGTSGAMSALGADASLMSTNPSGIALFRQSELVITPGFWTTKTNSSINAPGAVSFDESANNFGISNFGLIVASNPKTGKWSTVNFGIGLQRIADYRQDFFYRGRTNGSIVDRFTALADGLTSNQLDDFEAGLAFETGAIFGPFPDGTYGNDFLNNPDHMVQKSQLVKNTGRSNEMTISFAGNYDEKLMIGTTIGIPFYSFGWEKSYEEIDAIDEIPVFNRLQFDERLSASGTGVNFKFGLIYLPVHSVRVGLSLHTPTFLRITENFSNTLTYDFTDSGTSGEFRSSSPDGTFEYRITTPWRTSGSLGIIIPGFGFISAEAEYVDYSTSSFKFSSSNLADKEYERELNRDIDSRLASAINIRSGLEFARDIWRLRGGVLLEGSPFRGDNQMNFGWSMGAGIRENRFFLDLAYVRRTRDELYLPYAIENNFQTSVNNVVSFGQLVLTLGFKI